MAGVFQSLGGCCECVCGSSVLRGQYIEKQPIRMTKESSQEVHVYIYILLEVAMHENTVLFVGHNMNAKLS